MSIINLDLKKKKNPSNIFFCGLALISWVLLGFHERENYDCYFSLKWFFASLLGQNLWLPIKLRKHKSRESPWKRTALHKKNQKFSRRWSDKHCLKWSQGRPVPHIWSLFCCGFWGGLFFFFFNEVSQLLFIPASHRDLAVMKNSPAHSEFQAPHSVRQLKQGRASSRRSCPRLPAGTLTASGVLACPAVRTGGNPCPISTTDAVPCCCIPSSCQVERLAEDNESLWANEIQKLLPSDRH